MKEYKQYFKDLFTQATQLFESEITFGNENEEAEDYFSFEFNGVGFECLLLQNEGEQVILRTYVDAIKAGVFKDNMLEVYDIMNKFNLLEGGLFKLVAIENEEAQYNTIALKTVDVVVTKELMENGDVRYYHLNLLADFLNYVNFHEVYQAAYYDQIEEYNEFEW